jgi:hypothetical protein
MGATIRIAVIVAATSGGCGGSPTSPDTTLNELRNAPLAVSIDGTTIELRASLWRDFMPVVPPGGNPLQVSVRLSSAATTADIDRLWVLFGDELWDAAPVRSTGSAEWIARGGPQWPPGSRVDVVVRVRTRDGRARLVRAADQKINASF